MGVSRVSRKIYFQCNSISSNTLTYFMTMRRIHALSVAKKNSIQMKDHDT